MYFGGSSIIVSNYTYYAYNLQMSMSVPETQTTASKCALTLMGVTDVLATLDTHSIVMGELAEVAYYFSCL